MRKMTKEGILYRERRKKKKEKRKRWLRIMHSTCKDEEKNEEDGLFNGRLRLKRKCRRASTHI